MKYREFGKTGIKVSQLGFGAMRMPIIDGKSANLDEEKCIELIRHAVDCGINYIDTAEPYHGGNSEIVLGKALKDGYREKVYLATKMPSWKIRTSEDLDKIFNRQLEKLQVDYIDFYLLHALDAWRFDNYKKVDVFEFIERQKKNGKIKHIGFSFHDELDVFKQIIDEYDWDFCMFQYNFMDTDYQAGFEGYNYAKEKGLGIVVMEPLKGGSLVKNVPQDVQKIWDSINPEMSVANKALRFLWDHEDINVVLSGMSDIAQVDDSVKAANLAEDNSLNDDEKKVIEDVRSIYKKRMIVNCTSCKYCLPCPHGVDIPMCFMHLNNSSMYQDIERAKTVYTMFVDDEDKAKHCKKCGACEAKCPQHIKIMDMLDLVNDTFE